VFTFAKLDTLTLYMTVWTLRSFEMKGFILESPET